MAIWDNILGNIGNSALDAIPEDSGWASVGKGLGKVGLGAGLGFMTGGPLGALAGGGYAAAPYVMSGLGKLFGGTTQAEHALKSQPFMNLSPSVGGIIPTPFPQGAPMQQPQGNQGVNPAETMKKLAFNYI